MSNDRILEWGCIPLNFKKEDWNPSALKWMFDSAKRTINVDIPIIRVCVLAEVHGRNSSVYRVAWYSLPYEWEHDDTWKDIVYEWPGAFYKADGCYNGRRILARFTIHKDTDDETS